MIAKALDAVESEDVEDLIAGQVREGRTIEYKRELPGGADGDKKEFLADVSSFANTVGGDLLFGVEEASGVPSAVLGVKSANLDSEVRRLESLMQSGIEPRLRASVRVIERGTSDPVLLVRVEPSWISPHRVTLGGHDKFYGRSSAGKYPLDVEELRDAFLRRELSASRIRQFREERLIEIGREQTPVALRTGGRVVLHLIPWEAFSRGKSFDLSRWYSNSTLPPPMATAGGWSSRVTLEGVATFSPDGSGSAFAYTHLYRSGIIEAVDAYLLNPRADDGRREIPSLTFEQELIEAAEAYLGVLKDLGIRPPVYAMVSLLGARGFTLGVALRGGWRESGHAIDREVLALPESTVTDLSDPADRTMREAIDLVWNACGFVRSENYDADGRWRGRS